MNYTHRVPDTLHKEHFDTLAFLNKIEGFLGRNSVSRVPPHGGDLSEMLAQLRATVSDEITHHFRFEEEHLFPALAERGEGDICELLAEEHATILPVGQRLVELARAANAQGFSQDTWREFHRLAGELIERLVSHVQKEEMAILPVLDMILDPEADRQLEDAYLIVRSEAA